MSINVIAVSMSNCFNDVDVQLEQPCHNLCCNMSLQYNNFVGVHTMTNTNKNLVWINFGS